MSKKFTGAQRVLFSFAVFCCVAIFNGCSSDSQTNPTPESTSVGTSSATPASTPVDSQVAPLTQAATEPSEISLDGNAMIVVPPAYSLLQDSRMDAGRYVVWPGEWNGSPVLDIWIDTYVQMQYYDMMHPGELLSDAAFDFVDGMISAPVYDGSPCTSTPIDHEVTGSNRTVTYQIDCVDKKDNGPGDYVVTLARGDSHLVYIKAFSGTYRNNALEVPSSEVQEFYEAVQITVT